MTNLERLRKSTNYELVELLNDFANYWDSFGASTLPKIHFINEWLCKEHKEPIRLKQWEYDYFDSSIYFDNEFKYHGLCDVLKKKGHFKGVVNEFMTIREILDNCVVVSDDYEGFEECK